MPWVDTRCRVPWVDTRGRVRVVAAPNCLVVSVHEVVLDTDIIFNPHCKKNLNTYTASNGKFGNAFPFNEAHASVLHYAVLRLGMLFAQALDFEICQPIEVEVQ